MIDHHKQHFGARSNTYYGIAIVNVPNRIVDSMGKKNKNNKKGGQQKADDNDDEWEALLEAETKKNESLPANASSENVAKEG